MLPSFFLNVDGHSFVTWKLLIIYISPNGTHYKNKIVVGVVVSSISSSSSRSGGGVVVVVVVVVVTVAAAAVVEMLLRREVRRPIKMVG